MIVEGAQQRRLLVNRSVNILPVIRDRDGTGENKMGIGRQGLNRREEIAGTDVVDGVVARPGIRI